MTLIETVLTVDFWFGCAVALAFEETARAGLRTRLGQGIQGGGSGGSGG